MRYAVVIVHYGDPDLTRACLRSVEQLAAGTVVVFNSGAVPPDLDRSNLIVITPQENLGVSVFRHPAHRWRAPLCKC